MEHWLKGLIGVALILAGFFIGVDQLTTQFQTFAAVGCSVAAIYGGWHLFVAGLRGKLPVLEYRGLWPLFRVSKGAIDANY